MIKISADEDFSFFFGFKDKLELKVGEQVQFSVTGGSHTFIVDELNIYGELNLDSSFTLLFTPTAAQVGEYTFYCKYHGLPGDSRGMRATMVITN